MRIRWSPLAIRRAEEAVEFITQTRPKTAQDWVEKLFRATERLQYFPESGCLLKLPHKKDVREIFVGPYRVIYRLSASSVDILTIRHTRRLLDDKEF